MGLREPLERVVGLAVGRPPEQLELVLAQIDGADGVSGILIEKGAARA